MKKCAIFFSNISLQRKALEIWGCRSMHGLPFLAAFFSFNISTNIITLQIKCMFWSQIIKIKTYFPILSAPTLTNMFVRRKHFVFSTISDNEHEGTSHYHFGMVPFPHQQIRGKMCIFGSGYLCDIILVYMKWFWPVNTFQNFPLSLDIQYTSSLS